MAEARLRAAAGVADLCVAEAGLPDGSGIALLRELRAQGWVRGVVLDDVGRPLQRPRRDQRRRPQLPRLHRHAPAPCRRGPRTPRGEGVDSLSAREIQVLQLVADGKSNKDIGEELGLSPSPSRATWPGSPASSARATAPRWSSRRCGRARSPDPPGRHRSVPSTRAPSSVRLAGHAVQLSARPAGTTMSCRGRSAAHDGTGRHRCGGRCPGRRCPHVRGRDRAGRSRGAASRAAPAGHPARRRAPRRRRRRRRSPGRHAALAAGTGPVAVDAERASGYRYGQRAYLVQLRREGAGTVADRPGRLPRPVPRRRRRSPAPSGCCTPPRQDLPCLAEVGLRPRRAVRHRARRPGSPGCPGSGSPPSSSTASGSAWPRSTRPSTGRPGRCPSRGCATPRSTSRCWSSCATRSPRS